MSENLMPRSIPVTHLSCRLWSKSTTEWNVRESPLKPMLNKLNVKINWKFESLGRVKWQK